MSFNTLWLPLPNYLVDFNFVNIAHTLVNVACKKLAGLIFAVQVLCMYVCMCVCRHMHCRIRCCITYVGTAMGVVRPVYTAAEGSIARLQLVIRWIHWWPFSPPYGLATKLKGCSLVPDLLAPRPRPP